MKRTELKRKDIVEAAVEEFSTHGFEGARTAQIAKSAAVSTRTLFNHFPNKEALFDHMVDIVIEQTGAIPSTPYDPSLPIRDQLIKALQDYISAITDVGYMRLNRMVMSEYLRDQALADRIFAHAEMNTNPVRAIIEGAIAESALEEVDPQYATDLLSGPAKRSKREILVEMCIPRENDLYSDRIDDFRWNDLEQRKEKLDFERKLLSAWQQEDIHEMMSRVVYPYAMPHGKIVGYETTPDIDEHFASMVLPEFSNWQRQSGLFPEARIRGLKGSDIASVLGLCMSARLSHSQLVTVGKRKFDDVNYWLANTVWKPKSEIVSSLANFLNIDPMVVSLIVDRSTFGVASSVDLSSDVTPLCPPFIKISREYLLEPTSFLFSNPLDTFKRLNDDTATKNAIRIHRESHMAEEIHGLFQGDRFRCLDSRARLKQNGKTVTDVDAAVLDTMTGEVALFQLKWQEFSGANNRQQASRSRNFVDQVDTWTMRVRDWIESEGTGRLLTSLKFPVVETNPERVYLFAIGQQAARFSTYGFSLQDSRTAPATMNQFIRLRVEIGQVSNTLSKLFHLVRNETRSSPVLTPIPYTLTSGEYSIHFENMWNTFE